MQTLTNQLDAYIDESGDMGDYSQTQSSLFVCSITVTPNPTLLALEQANLNTILRNLNHSEMLHTAPLVRGTGSYQKLSNGLRRKILKNYLWFSSHAGILAHSIIIDRSKFPSTTSLVSKLSCEFNIFLTTNLDFFNHYPLVKFHYDNGQPRVTKILNKIIQQYPNFHLKEGTVHDNDRAYQTADLYTYIDKLYFKIQNGIPLGIREQRFFSMSDIKFIQSLVENNRIGYNTLFA